MLKRGELLIENVIFIILNLVIFAILVLFILNKGNGISGLEDSYSKQIALLIDSAKPGTEIKIDLSKAKEANEKWFSENYVNAVRITENLVTVQLDEKSSKSYSFFNNVVPRIDVYPEGSLLIVIDNKGVEI
jgi:hypothetical protein